MNDLIRSVLGPGRPGRDPNSSDAELLTAYTRDGDHAAFARLVERHGPMVYAVCRRLLTDPNDADDAFQAVFLVFIRRADSLRGGRLAGWFYGVALRTAKETRKVTARRQRLDEKYRTNHPPSEGEPADPTEVEDLRAVLDRELGRLTESARAAIILCDMEGRTRKEAAAELGCPEGTLATRLARARELLASRLSRLGIALGATALVAFLASESRAAVPSKVKQEVLRFPVEVSATPVALGLASKVAIGTSGLRAGLLVTALVSAVAVTVSGVIWVTKPGAPGPWGDAPPPVALAPAPKHDMPWPVPHPPSGFSLVAADGQKSTFICDQDGVVGEKPVTPPENAIVAPDGKRFVMIADAEGGIKKQIFVGKIGTPGEALRDRVWLRPNPIGGEIPRSLDPSWSPDGKRIVLLVDPESKCMEAFARQNVKGMVMVVSPDSQEFRGPVFLTEKVLAKPKYHPDGRRIAVLHEVAKSGNEPLYDLVLHAGQNREVLVPRARVHDYAFSPDGSRVAVSVVGQGLTLLDLESLDKTEIPLPIRGVDRQLDFGELLWRPDGKVIAFRPVFLRGTKFVGTGLQMNVTPVKPENQNRVGFIRLGDSLSVETKFELDTGYKLTHWVTDQPQPR